MYPDGYYHRQAISEGRSICFKRKYTYVFGLEVNMLNERWGDPVNITKEQWISLLRDGEVIKEEDIEVLKLVYTSVDSMATASQLARLLNIPL